MIPAAQFRKHFDKLVRPTLLQKGFHGEKWKYCKVVSDDYAHILSVDLGKYGGECTLSANIFIKNISDSWGRFISPDETIPVACHLSKWITSSSSRKSWEFGENEEEALGILNEIAIAIEAEAFPYFDNFTTFPKPLDSILVSDLEERSEQYMNLGIRGTEARKVLFLATLHRSIGNVNLSNDFCKYGLRMPGLIESARIQFLTLEKGRRCDWFTFEGAID